MSAATLSRVERGLMPDLQTFGKICRWLMVDPGEILGVEQIAPTPASSAVHFRKDQALDVKTAQALGEMILAAQRAFIVSAPTRSDEDA